MDAVKYLKERNRMCDSYNNMCDECTRKYWLAEVE